MQTFFSRPAGLCFLVAGGTLLASMAGCGGGGNGGGATLPTSTPTTRATTTPTTSATTTPTTIATSVAGVCNSTTYSPNYYGLPEPGATDSSSNVYTHWTQFPVAVYIPASADAGFRSSTIAGFNQWLAPTNGRANYTLVTNASDANLVVVYSPQNPSSATLGLTTVSYFDRSKTIDSVKMELFFYKSGQSNNDASNQSIAAHEFGHALGIGTHSPFKGDLMYPSLVTPVENVTTRDANTLKTIYCNNFPTRSTSAEKNLGPIVSKIFD